MTKQLAPVGGPPRKNKVPRIEKKRMTREELSLRLRQLLAEIDREGLRVSVQLVEKSGTLHAYLHERTARLPKESHRTTYVGSMGMGGIIAP